MFKIEKTILSVLIVKTMGKNEKELKTSKYHSYFIMKVLLFVSCVTNVVLLAVVVKDFASLKDLNSRMNTLEELILGLKSLRREKHDQETRRSKRATDEAKFNKAMIKLERLEGRYRRRFVLTICISKFLTFLLD